MLQSLQSAHLPTPRFRYSPLVKAGPYYHTAGMVALDPRSGQLIEGGVYDETRAILHNLTAALPDFGLSLADMVSARVFTAKFSEFARINAAWEEVFPKGGHLPARTAVGVAALPLNASVEMEFLFFKERAA